MDGSVQPRIDSMWCMCILPFIDVVSIQRYEHTVPHCNCCMSMDKPLVAVV